MYATYTHNDVSLNYTSDVYPNIPYYTSNFTTYAPYITIPFCQN